MSEFKLPHVEDLTTNSKLPGQLTEDFKAIEQEDKDDDQALSDEVTDRKKGDGNLKGQIDELQERCQKLEDDKATHDEVKQVSQEWNKRASHIARGTDIATTRAVVMQILDEIGKKKINSIIDNSDIPLSGGATIDTLYTDKAIYKPNERLELTFNASNAGIAKVRVFDMANQIYQNDVTVEEGENSFNWQIPDGDYKGYLIEVAGSNSQFIAVNVNNHVEYVPIMGFLGNFGPGISEDQMNSIVKQLNRFHVNYVQFYDWYDRDDTPLRIVDGKPEQNWIDFMKRPTSFDTVKNYIDVVHNYGMQAMFYNLIYGSQLGIPSSDDSNLNWTNPNLTKEMFLYKNKDLTEYAGENHGGKLSITYMNPLNGAWGDYIAGQANVVYQNLPFDGWHVDQLGTLPSDTYSSDGVHLDWGSFGDGYGAVLKHAKAKNPDKRLTINNVDDIGTEKVMASNTVDFMYVEPWGGIGFSFKQLASYIRNSTQKYSKPMVIPSYVNKEKAETNNQTDGMVNDAAAFLCDAMEMSNGASHLEWGEHYLANEYFPNSNLKLRDSSKTIIMSYLDTFVEFLQILNGKWIDDPVTSSTHQLSTGFDKDKITTVYKRSGFGSIVSLVNMIGIAHDNWQDPQGTQVMPQVQSNIQLTIPVENTPSGVFLIKADESPAPQPIDFTQNGNSISITVDKLSVWDLIYIKP